MPWEKFWATVKLRLRIGLSLRLGAVGSAIVTRANLGLAMELGLD